MPLQASIVQADELQEKTFNRLDAWYPGNLTSSHVPISSSRCGDIRYLTVLDLDKKGAERLCKGEKGSRSLTLYLSPSFYEKLRVERMEKRPHAEARRRKVNES